MEQPLYKIGDVVIVKEGLVGSVSQYIIEEAKYYGKEWEYKLKDGFSIQKESDILGKV